jgi:predicted HicB family RNase H-like nuclease
MVAKGLTVMPDPKDYVVNDDASISDVDLDREKIFFQGERLTEDRAERIAETALRDARHRGLIPGRKSLSGGNTHSPRLEVRVPADLHREITERAKRENVTVSKLVREILQRYVDEEAA